MVKKQIPLTARQVEELLDIRYEQLPRHIAVIPDGNGRWAKKRNQTRIMGHREGINVVRSIVRECRRLGVGYLTLYAFSQENWNRPDDEVAALWLLLKSYVQQELPELEVNGVRLQVIGRTERIPEDVKKEIDIALDRTKNNSKMVLTIALSYSGRDELVRAMQRFATSVKSGEVGIDELTEEKFSDYLDTDGMPDPDLLIRTSGESRISNYLLWQLAYSELSFVDVFWPDFNIEFFHRALKNYVRRERRFGKTSEQLDGNDS